MKIVKWFFYIILGMAALILVVGLFLPKSVEIVSEAEINLPANKVYYSLSTFSDHASWDPWLEEDSTAILEVSLVEGVVGSKYSWTSTNSGSGEMVIDSVVPGKHIYYTLSFTGMSQKPRVWNDITEKDGKSIVSWGFYQDASYPAGRIFMAAMKGSLQKDYDRGMVNLKKLLEEKGVKMSSLSEPVIEEIPGFFALVSGGKGSMEEIGARMHELYRNIIAEVEKQGLVISGYPFSHYLSYDEATGVSVFEAGVPVNKAGKTKGDIRAISVPSFMAVKAIHTGPYAEFGDSYNKLMKHIEDNKIDTKWEAWELYLTAPDVEKDETKWKTAIAFPLK